MSLYLGNRLRYTLGKILCLRFVGVMDLFIYLFRGGGVLIVKTLLYDLFTLLRLL